MSEERDQWTAEEEALLRTMNCECGCEHDDDGLDDDDPLAAFAGIAFGVLVCIALWVLVAMVVGILWWARR